MSPFSQRFAAERFGEPAHERFGRVDLIAGAQLDDEPPPVDAVAPGVLPDDGHVA